MYQRILVPIDGSVTAARGLVEATQLAKDQGAKLRVIHVVNELTMVASYEGVIYSGELIDALRENGHTILAKAAEQLKASGLQVETALLEAHGGNAGDTIVKDAEQWQADIIVLGTHGRRGLGRLVMGSDAEQVVRQAKVPVLLVRSLAATK
jgi:nucleotide-binding universal stress UspA family protein